MITDAEATKSLCDLPNTQHVAALISQSHQLRKPKLLYQTTFSLRENNNRTL